MSIAEKLKEVRENKGESQRALASKIKWHQVQIARYETGHNTPPISYIVEICKHYGVSADYILELPKRLSWPDESAPEKPNTDQ